MSSQGRLGWGGTSRTKHETQQKWHLAPFAKQPIPLHSHMNAPAYLTISRNGAFTPKQSFRIQRHGKDALGGKLSL